ncbi:DEAD/DEAH box helicase [Polycladomyces sp. WAk]|uniref:DNA 3'-5' helicase n=1 Tax=Polycladomyces zharkentensis TaxID=2807616 RepID=A0ABS2WGT9_9BACL|nr:DEAD/DEAH box helicase [Polycladomyces sp. WAk]
MYRPDLPLIVQRDRTLLLEVRHPLFDEVRDRLASFAELVKNPEYIHTYRLTPLSLWNAAASGVTVEEVTDVLTRYSKFELPSTLLDQVRDWMSRYGKIQLRRIGNDLTLGCRDRSLWKALIQMPEVRELALKTLDETTVVIDPAWRGKVKQLFLRMGYPVEDIAGYSEGKALDVALRDRCRSGESFALRSYQRDAADAFYRSGSVYGGNGVLVLPCGAGKTIVGLAAMARVKRETLILTPNATSVRQWVREILDKTYLPETCVGQYTGEIKRVAPVTVATYQILTHRSNQNAPFTHMQLFEERDWGLIIYDEVHLLPAPVFRATADLQAKRRLGLTATLVREDGRQEDVFSLIGPKKYDVPWKVLESKGWIAEAVCTEIRTPMPPEIRQLYACAQKRHRYRIAAENPNKVAVLRAILRRHAGESVLIIGEYLSQLEEIAQELSAPLITGRLAQRERDRLYERFRKGEIPVLVVSKVANFAIDLPDAGVAVQVSGAFGSRQEEAQRLGRILRPKQGRNQAHFYHIVSRDTVDQEMAMHRQLFLVEQGYRYNIRDAEQWEVEQ